MAVNDRKANLESVMLSYYVKYDRLLPMINVSFDGYSDERVDIYVDLYDMLKSVYTQEVYANKKFVIVAYIINLIAHYRNYFRTRHGVASRIYLVYNSGDNLNHKQFVRDFGDDSFRDVVNYASTDRFIKEQLKLVKILVGYINEAYYVEKSTNFAMFTYDTILRNPTIPSIILTKSQYCTQIPVMCRNAILVRPKKVTGEDSSYFVCYNTAIPNYFYSINGEKNVQRMMNLRPETLSLLMAIYGLSKFGVRALCNATQTLKLVGGAIESNRIINGYNSDIDYVYDSLDGIDHYIDKTNFRFRFCALDLIYQHRIYMNMPEALDTTWAVNFYDPESIQEINNNYFADMPLDLESL